MHPRSISAEQVGPSTYEFAHPAAQPGAVLSVQVDGRQDRQKVIVVGAGRGRFEIPLVNGGPAGRPGTRVARKVQP
jgi:hypothetical protein